MTKGLRKSNRTETHDLGLSITHNYTGEINRKGKRTSNISIYNNDDSYTDTRTAFRSSETKYQMFKYQGGTLGGFERLRNGTYKNKQIGGGTRGSVTWLSKQSRRNLLKTLYRIDLSLIHI